jgi:subtilisin family serine protease
VAAEDNNVDVVGVAPGAPLTGVKVLGDNASGCNKFGSNSVVIKGVDWVTANAARPTVANMSLDNSNSQALDDAVRNSAASGVIYSIAAGNGAEPACNLSPARAGLAKIGTNSDGVVDYNDSNGIVTTAATTATNSEASFSNYGKCVDIWAPGLSIPSTQLGGGITNKSRTSMATPRGSGGAALYLSAHAGSSPTLSKDPSDSRHAGVRGRILREHSESRSFWQPRTFFSPLFTGVRGRGILKKFV